MPVRSATCSNTVVAPLASSVWVSGYQVSGHRENASFGYTLLMLEEADYERYRRMTPAERVGEYRTIMRGVWGVWKHLSAAEIQRRLDASAEIHDRSNQALLRELQERDRG